jgi:cell division protein FtsB
MKHLILTLMAITLISSIAYYTLTHPNRDEVGRLRGELSQLESRNESMRVQNQGLERKILALRDDPRLAERRARESAGLAKPHELIFKFDTPEAPQAVQVSLEVSPKKISLAGREVALDKLQKELGMLQHNIPNAALEVRFDDALGPIARQRIQDMVESSPLENVTYVGSPE